MCCNTRSWQAGVLLVVEVRTEAFLLNRKIDFGPFVSLFEASLAIFGSNVTRAKPLKNERQS
jgi:hypothetical protein